MFQQEFESREQPPLTVVNRFARLDPFSRKVEISQNMPTAFVVEDWIESNNRYLSIHNLLCAAYF